MVVGVPGGRERDRGGLERRRQHVEVLARCGQHAESRLRCRHVRLT